MPTITTPTAALHGAASLLPFAARGRDAKITPIISGVAVSVTGGEFTAIATDRYVVGELRVDTDARDLDPVVLPPDLLTAYAKTAPRTGDAVLTTTDGPTWEQVVTITTDTSGHTSAPITGTIPAVSRLLEDDLAELYGTALLNPAHLELLGKIRDPRTGKRTRDTIRIGRNGTDTGSPKPSPLAARITFGEYRYRFLIQPHLDLDHQ